MQLSQNTLSIEHSAIRKMFNKALEYAHIISFTLGEPDFTASENVVEAGCKAIRDGHTKYSANSGIPELRKAKRTPATPTIPGLSCKAPRGTFYSFVNIKGTHKTSDEFAYDLLDKKQVVVVPGTAFGPGGEGYIRISYATSLEQIQKGMDLIEEYVKEYCK
ncbi:MAG: aminotransferase class I/II-fold pyridoxal phosphate-dependent enzyme [Eubacteriales bacterium]